MWYNAHDAQSGENTDVLWIQKYSKNDKWSEALLLKYCKYEYQADDAAPTIWIPFTLTLSAHAIP